MIDGTLLSAAVAAAAAAAEECAFMGDRRLPCGKVDGRARAASSADARRAGRYARGPFGRPSDGRPRPWRWHHGRG